MNHSFRRVPIPLVFILLVVICFHCANSRANVYATNVRLNGGTTNLVLVPGDSISISYLLNEQATAGVSIQVKSGATIARTITIAAGAPGSLRGTNSIVWDGKNNSGGNIPAGTYSISVIPAATGFGAWTQTSVDTNAGNYVYEPHGIAVNKNSASPYYGRVFVANSQEGNSNLNPGDNVGLLKLNPDGSPAQEGEYSTGGYPWSGQDFSPWKIEVGADDRVYVNDWITNGIVLSFDQTISATSMLQVLRADNWPNYPDTALSGPAITGTATNMQIWMADETGDVTTSVGIRGWSLNAQGIIAQGDLGKTVVQAGGGSDLDGDPVDVSVDGSGRIYAIHRSTSGDPAFSLLRFPAYSGSGPAETRADWKIGASDPALAGAWGVAVDPTGTYVAVTRGEQNDGDARIFNAASGAAVVTLDPTNHWHSDVAWDNVGNLYTTDQDDQVWRVYSPPGANQASTVAVGTVRVLFSGAPPILSNPSYASHLFHCTLTGEANVIYIIQASSDLVNWMPVATNLSPSSVRQLTIAAPMAVQFYRAGVGGYSPAPPAPAVLSAPGYSAGMFHFTLTGTADTTYVIQSSSNLKTWTAVATNTAPTAVRQITVPSAAGVGFFRAFSAP